MITVFIMSMSSHHTRIYVSQPEIPLAFVGGVIRTPRNRLWIEQIGAQEKSKRAAGVLSPLPARPGHIFLSMNLGFLLCKVNLVNYLSAC